MEQHIDKLLRFIDENDISSELNRLAHIDGYVKFQWNKAKIDQELRRIQSAEKVKTLFDYFENCVMSSPTDIKGRNACRHEMFIAQYTALYGLKVWYDRTNVVSFLKNPNFPDFTEADVNEIISRLESIIKRLNRLSTNFLHKFTGMLKFYSFTQTSMMSVIRIISGQKTCQINILLVVAHSVSKSIFDFEKRSYSIAINKKAATAIRSCSGSGAVAACII